LHELHLFDERREGDAEEDDKTFPRSTRECQRALALRIYQMSAYYERITYDRRRTPIVNTSSHATATFHTSISAYVSCRNSLSVGVMRLTSLRGMQLISMTEILAITASNHESYIKVSNNSNATI